MVRLRFHGRSSNGADCYYLYRDFNPIMSISGLNFIANQTSNSDINTIGSVGMYYYVVIAASQFGNSSLSNCVNITVSVPVVNLGSITPNPSTSSSVSLSWTTPVGTSWYYLFRDINPIVSVNWSEFHCKLYNQF